MKFQTTLFSVITSTLVLAALNCNAMTPKQSFDTTGLHITQIIALEDNGSPRPAQDALCRAQFHQYLGRVYIANFKTLDAATIKLCSTDGCGVLQNASLRDVYSFWSPNFDGAERVFYSTLKGAMDQRIGLFFDYQDFQCAATAGQLPKQ